MIFRTSMVLMSATVASSVQNLGLIAGLFGAGDRTDRTAALVLQRPVYQRRSHRGCMARERSALIRPDNAAVAEGRATDLGLALELVLFSSGACLLGPGRTAGCQRLVHSSGLAAAA